MKIHQKTPQVITDQQRDGRKYIVYDREHDPVEWVVARHEIISMKPGKYDCDGSVLVEPDITYGWMTVTIEPKQIHPTHYVELSDDFI